MKVGYAVLSTTLALAACGRADLLDDLARQGAGSGGGGPQLPRDGKQPLPSRPGKCGAAEVHVVGVYEPRPDGAVVQVLLDRPGHHVVVASSYESVAWSIRAASPASVIDRIILVGYHAQKLVEKTSASVETRSYDERTLGDHPSCGYSYPYNGGGCDTNELLASVQGELGHVTTFSGTYQGNGFILRTDDTADIGTSGGYESYHFTRPCRATEPAPQPPTPPERSVCGPTAGGGPDAGVCPKPGTTCDRGKPHIACRLHSTGEDAIYACAPAGEDKRLGIWALERTSCEKGIPIEAKLPSGCYYAQLPPPPPNAQFDCPAEGNPCGTSHPVLCGSPRGTRFMQCDERWGAPARWWTESYDGMIRCDGTAENPVP